VHLVRVPIANKVSGTQEYAVCEDCLQAIEVARTSTPPTTAAD
jgi:hypothetical protein